MPRKKLKPLKAFETITCRCQKARQQVAGDLMGNPRISADGEMCVCQLYPEFAGKLKRETIPARFVHIDARWRE